MQNRPDIGKSGRSKDIAQAFIARLEDLETLLAEEDSETLAARLENPNPDAVPKGTFLDNRQDLLKEIQVAKALF